MLEKFGTQFIRIFSKPVPATIVADSDIDDAIFETLSDREYARRVHWFEARTLLAQDVQAAHDQWQAAVAEAHRLKLEYLSVLGRFDPAFVKAMTTDASADPKIIPFPGRFGELATVTKEDL